MATIRSAALPAASAGLFALASLIDIAFLAAIGSKDAAPLPVILLFAVLGVLTLATLIPARRGNRPAVIVAVVLRCISGVLAFVSFFASAPAWIMAAEAVVIVVTVVALVLMRRRSVLTVPA
ncbi:MAG TPA: hypothetical protein VGJ28_24910 [Micromonosporaceae bacterium]